MDSTEGAYTRFFREGVGHRMVRQNHQTLVALAAWFGGRYFSTHYGFEEAEEWMAASADVFKGQAVSFKPIEDANAYQWMTLDHILTYTLASGDTTYIDNGNCRRSLDQAVHYCNNRGALPAFGDTGAPMEGYPTNFLVKAGHVLQDGRAAFLLGKRFGRPSDYFRPQPPGERYESVSDPLLVRSFEKYFCDGLAPEIPVEMAGVTGAGGRGRVLRSRGRPEGEAARSEAAESAKGRGVRHHLFPGGVRPGGPVPDAARDLLRQPQPRRREYHRGVFGQRPDLPGGCIFIPKGQRSSTTMA